MLKVPACRECNHTKSRVDNALRDFLTIDIDSSRHPLALELQKTKTIRAARDNQVRLLDGFFEGSEVPVFTPDGLLDGVAWASPFDPDPVLDAVKWATRGLHWNEFGESVDESSARVTLVDRYSRRDTVVQMAVVGWTGHLTQGEPFTTGWVSTASGKVYWCHIFFDTVLFVACSQTNSPP